MLTKVEAVSARGEVLSLPLSDLSSGYLVQEIDGLDPVKAVIVDSEFAQLDGTEYQTSRREPRFINMKIGLEDGYGVATIRELRSRLYNFFMPKSVVTLRFYMDDVLFVTIPGRVEACESPMFSKDPVLEVSVKNFNPDFIAPSSVVVPGLTSSDATELVHTYPGSVETGFVLTVAANRPFTEMTVFSRPEGGAFQSIEFAEIVETGDILTISTVSRSKYARLSRAGVERSVLFGVSPSSTWANLFPGDNHIRVAVDGAPIPYSIQYQARYGGL